MTNSVSKRVSRNAVVATGGFRVPNAAELVAQEIRSRIIRGALRAGDALPPEQELTSQFGVSRPVLRQALRILESERLLDIRRGQHGGPIVRRPDASTAARHFGLLLQFEGAKLQEVFQARRLLEEPTARRAAEEQDQELIAALRANLESHEELLADADSHNTRLQELSREFHSLLMAHNANTALMLFDSMLDSVIAMASRSLVDSQETMAARRELNSRSLRSHRKLLKFIEAGEVETADEFWNQHLAEVGDYYMTTAPLSGLVVDLMTT